MWNVLRSLAQNVLIECIYQIIGCSDSSNFFAVQGIRRPWKGVLMFGPPGTGEYLDAHFGPLTSEPIELGYMTLLLTCVQVKHS